ncbi:MAG: LysM peptidoglycan-binding domain-containing protein [Treponema sp.]|nr:LysM peptidoglycan-binding domain-containing protein [Treponema sp.]
MKSIGIKLADGSFYPILEEGSIETKDLEVTTVKDNQTKVQIDLYRSETNSMEDAEYVDSLEISHLKPHPNGVPTLNLELNLDSDNKLHAQVKDQETGKSTQVQVSLVSRTLEERQSPANFALNDSSDEIMPGVAAVDSILNSPNDEEFNFDPVSDLTHISEDLDDIEDTTIDLASLDVDSIEDAQISDEFLTDSQIIDDDIVSDKPLTDQDMLIPPDLFNDEGDNKKDDRFVDKDGTGFSFVDDSESDDIEAEPPLSEPETSTTSAEDEFQVPPTLFDSSLFDETRTDSDPEPEPAFEPQIDAAENSEPIAEEKADVDLDIAPPDFSDLELDDIGEMELEPELSMTSEPEEPGVEAPDIPEEPESGFADETAFDVPSESSAAETPETSESSYDLPEFDDLPTETAEEPAEKTAQAEAEPVPEESVPELETESNFDFSLPTFDELGTDASADFDDSSLGDFTLPADTDTENELDSAQVEKDLSLVEPEFTEPEPAAETTDSESVDEAPVSSDESSFSVDDLELPDFGDVDLSTESEPEFAVDQNIEPIAVPETEETPVVDSEIGLDLPDFDDADLTDAAEPEANETIEAEPESPSESLDLPDFGEDGSADTESLDLPDFGEDGSAETENISLPESAEDESAGTESLDLPDFGEDGSAETESISLPESAEDESAGTESLDLPDFGEDGSADTESISLPESAEDESASTESLDLPDFGEDGSADTDSLSLPDFGDDGSAATETKASDDTKFDIDGMDLPDFDNLDKTSEPSGSESSGLPDFDDPFNSLSSPTGGTDFDYPDFDDSPLAMDAASEKEDSETKAIFGDFDDTDAVFEGETEGFKDPTAGKKKSKKAKKNVRTSSEYDPYAEDENREDKGNKKLMIFLLAALAACVAVICILVLQSRGASGSKKTGPEIADTKTAETVKSNSNVTSMGEPRAEIVVEPESDSVAIEQVAKEPESAAAETTPAQVEKTPSVKETVSERIVSEEKKITGGDEELAVRRPKIFEPAKKVEPKPQVVIPAKEDTIIVAANPESVVPVKKNPTATSGSDIKYTVVWGDTLWDISNAYYKTPYRYDSIAKHNGITDANKIKSGQVLLIPAE